MCPHQEVFAEKQVQPPKVGDAVTDQQKPIRERKGRGAPQISGSGYTNRIEELYDCENPKIGKLAGEENCTVSVTCSLKNPIDPKLLENKAWRAAILKQAKKEDVSPDAEELEIKKFLGQGFRSKASDSMGKKYASFRTKCRATSATESTDDGQRVSCGKFTYDCLFDGWKEIVRVKVDDTIEEPTIFESKVDFCAVFDRDLCVDSKAKDVDSVKPKSRGRGVGR
jgi:hypothetical protein